MNRRAILLGALFLPAACGYRPVRFADRAPVTRVHDDRAIPLPEAGAFIEEFHQADVYVRRELVNALDPRREGEALDANSLDEVPRSSWFRPPRDPHRPLEGYRRDGPPVAPFTVTGDAPASGMPDGQVIVDARGLRYELLPDLEEKPLMRTAAAAIASRLVWALGYHAAEVHVIRSHEGTRVAAMRWPVGVDLGPTPMERRRDDDPNDHLPHLDRRTLRALPRFTAWLAMTRLPARALRDVYVGAPGEGHVEHHVVGVEGALGVDGYLDALAWERDPDREESNFFLRMFSLGLSPKPAAPRPDTVFPSVGYFDERLLDEHLRPAPPFEPLDRLQPADAYWAAKRLAALPVGAIAEALAAGRLEPAASHWLYQVLHLRRAALIGRGFDATTPCEVVTLEPARRGRRAVLVLADLAVDEGFVRSRNLFYDAYFLDAEGELLTTPRRITQLGSMVRVPLPPELSDQPYVVVRVRAARDGRLLPRAFEAHLEPRGAGVFRLLGARH